MDAQNQSELRKARGIEPEGEDDPRRLVEEMRKKIAFLRGELENREWMSVAMKIPNAMVEYLVVDCDGDQAIAFYDTEGWRNRDSGDIIEPTHFMNLPQKPEPEETE